MTHIQKSVTINAPIDKVVAILDNPDLASELNPNLKLLSHSPSPLGYFNTTWEYNMAGVKFKGASTVAEYQKGKRIVYDSKGGIDSHWDWTLNAEGNTTTVSLSLDYTMPGSFLGAAVNKLFIESQNEKSIDEELANLKKMSEAGG